MIRISDIAEDVGVSRSLVSKVLSGRMGRSTVRPELAAKIQSRARELGYVPNVSARALFSGRQSAIGVFISRHGQPGSGLVEAFIDGVADELAKSRQRMILQFFHDEAGFDDCLAVAHLSVLDGVVVAGGLYFDILPKIRTIRERGVPVAELSRLEIGSNGEPRLDDLLAAIATSWALGIGADLIRTGIETLCTVRSESNETVVA